MNPWLVALARAAGLAVVAALLAFISVVPNTHDPWVIVPAMLAAVLSAFGYRGVAEGVADTARANNAAARAERAAK